MFALIIVRLKHLGALPMFIFISLSVAVNCKWVFILKYNADGSLQGTKHDLWLKDITRPIGIDYQEIAPVVKINRQNSDFFSCALQVGATTV